ncbi:PTS fructose-like transporter subunit IIB [Enterococcus sp. BWB1-3]|uniref:PTS fructose-like transporter subunit IIB n=1 Tax=unclassified Enterococcus TaxID=2608891 RepID=UPI001921232B|nr:MULTISPECIES: PTS fructose-like transporter subunit IIB [unclassified Enterococcus]MBL1229804.1 PTS fructose-like transporter subunit IIB [Enterococcus sp. BWB1-3]MCB5952446.1 PTS fructose-like transporter subunit IIB [Enterococcus sp. BWT-B8]MCB5955398.1 PTS fructose-like transporter subunit IIB [Enterococcus sp. CWB-B31]
MKLVAVTACPSGVAHTYLAAESLEVAAKKNGVEICVETQGSIGIENEISAEQVAAASAVILTNNIGIKNEERFKGKPVVRVSAGDCINKAELIIKKIQEKLG